MNTMITQKKRHVHSNSLKIPQKRKMKRKKCNRFKNRCAKTGPPRRAARQMDSILHIQRPQADDGKGGVVLAAGVGAQ